MGPRWRMVGWFGAIGLVATVVIAWAAAATARVSGQQIQSLTDVDDSTAWTVTVYDLPAGKRIDSTRKRGLAWSPEQATGAPDAPGMSDNPNAWASLGQDDRDEWLELKYAKAVAPLAIHVHESYCPGAVVKATLFDSGGKEVTVWENANPTTQPSGVVVLPVRKPIVSDRVKLYIDSKRVAGWNEIDAVGMKDAQGQLHWAKWATASTTYARAGQGGQKNPQLTLPSWAASLATPTAGFAAQDVKTERRTIDARGWPFVALYGEVIPGSYSLALPTRPIWSGIAADVLILAAAAAALWFVTVVLRRFVVESLRLRRGRCMCCGYDLRFDLAHGCPECGWRRSAVNA